MSRERRVRAIFPRIRDVDFLRGLNLVNTEDDDDYRVYRRSYEGKLQRRESLTLRVSTSTATDLRDRNCDHKSVSSAITGEILYCVHVGEAVSYALTVCEASVSSVLDRTSGKKTATSRAV